MVIWNHEVTKTSLGGCDPCCRVTVHALPTKVPVEERGWVDRTQSHHRNWHMEKTLLICSQAHVNNAWNPWALTELNHPSYEHCRTAIPSNALFLAGGWAWRIFAAPNQQPCHGPSDRERGSLGRHGVLKGPIQERCWQKLTWADAPSRAHMFCTVEQLPASTSPVVQLQTFLQIVSMTRAAMLGSLEKAVWVSPNIWARWQNPLNAPKPQSRENSPVLQQLRPTVLQQTSFLRALG